MLRLLTGYLAGFFSGWGLAPLLHTRRRLRKGKRIFRKRRVVWNKARARRLTRKSRAALRKECKRKGGIFPWQR